MALELDHVSASSETSARTLWRAITILFALALFGQAVFAGAMLSGVEWARMAHRITAMLLVASTVTAGLVCALTLRRIRHGMTLSFILLALAAAIVVQMVLGALSAKGVNLLWLHVPLGVALVGLAGQAVVIARKLGSAP